MGPELVIHIALKYLRGVMMLSALTLTTLLQGFTTIPAVIHHCGEFGDLRPITAEIKRSYKTVYPILQ